MVWKGMLSGIDDPNWPIPEKNELEEFRKYRDQMLAAEIDYINAHATSTQAGDASEAKAINEVFGDSKPYVSSTKSMIGHLLGAAGAVEAGITSLVVERGIMPPTINYETPDPDCDLDYVANVSRNAEVNVALCNCIGFGSKNSALIVERFVS